MRCLRVEGSDVQASWRGDVRASRLGGARGASGQELPRVGCKYSIVNALGGRADRGQRLSMGGKGCSAISGQARPGRVFVQGRNPCLWYRESNAHGLNAGQRLLSASTGSEGGKTPVGSDNSCG